MDYIQENQRVLVITYLANDNVTSKKPELGLNESNSEIHYITPVTLADNGKTSKYLN